MKRNFFANALDNVISTISPRWGWKRAMFRQGLDSFRYYEAARQDRLNPVQTIAGTAEQIQGADRVRLRSLARWLEDNSDIAEAVLGAIERNVVGTGIIPQARIKKGKDYDDVLNNKLEEHWKEFAANCDMAGLSNFYELQRIALRREQVDGEAFFKINYLPNTEMPLKLQGIEADQLADYLFRVPGSKNYLVSGVEVDEYYRPLAYWINKIAPDGMSNMDPERVPADQIIHLFLRNRFTQVRGISQLARVMTRMRETGEYMDAELVKRQIAACFAAFVKKQHPGQSVGRVSTNKSGERIKTFVPGMIEYLDVGEDIEFANPSGDATSVADIIRIEQRMIGAGKGLSYETVSRDVSQANYSSARINKLEDQKTYLGMQSFIIEHLCKKVWPKFVEMCVLTGRVKIQDFWSNPKKYLVCDWIAPGFTWVDPLKDVQGSKQELMSGMTSLSRICAERGLDWREVLEQAAREKNYAESLGLMLDIHYPVKNNVKAPNSEEGKDEKNNV